MRTMLIWLMLCSACFAQYNTQADVTPIESKIIMADSVVSYDVDGRVAVILENPDAKPSLGLVLSVKSEAKWVTVSAGKSFTELKPLPKIGDEKYLLVGQAGKYLALILESSPDGPPAFQFMELHLGEIQPEPDPDQPVGDFTSLENMVRASVVSMNEPRVSEALFKAYSKVSTDPNLKIGDASGLRQATLLELRGVARPWNFEFAKWDAEAHRLGVGDITRYRAALAAIAAGLKSTQAKQVKYRQVCINGVCYMVAE